MKFCHFISFVVHKLNYLRMLIINPFWLYLTYIVWTKHWDIYKKLFFWRKKVIQVRNDMRLSERWQHFHFLLDYLFKLSYFSVLPCIFLFDLCSNFTCNLLSLYSCNEQFFQSVCEVLSADSEWNPKQIAELLRSLGFSISLIDMLPRSPLRSRWQCF